MPRVFIGVGSNLEPEQNLKEALGLIRERLGEPSLSPVYRSRSVGFDGPEFLNLVISLDTELDPRALWTALRQLEDALGRNRSEPKFSSRPLDLDLLLHGDLVIEEEGLTLPHPDILRYPFVLVPLSELAPRLEHPTRRVTMRRLVAELGFARNELRRVELLGLEKP